MKFTRSHHTTTTTLLAAAIWHDQDGVYSFPIARNYEWNARDDIPEASQSSNDGDEENSVGEMQTQRIGFTGGLGPDSTNTPGTSSQSQTPIVHFPTTTSQSAYATASTSAPSVSGNLGSERDEGEVVMDGIVTLGFHVQLRSPIGTPTGSSVGSLAYEAGTHISLSNPVCGHTSFPPQSIAVIVVLVLIFALNLLNSALQSDGALQQLVCRRNKSENMKIDDALPRPFSPAQLSGTAISPRAEAAPVK